MIQYARGLRRRGWIVGLGVAGLMAGAVIFSGCETSPASQPVSISPDSATIHYQESIALTAVGGYDYQWTLSNPALGILAPRTGMTVTYTSQNNPGVSNTAVQVVTLTSTISTFSGGSTVNSNGVQNVFTKTAQAFITHIP